MGTYVAIKVSTNEAVQTQNYNTKRSIFSEDSVPVYGCLFIIPWTLLVPLPFPMKYAGQSFTKNYLSQNPFGSL